MDEAELVRRAGRGDPEAAGAIWQAHRRWIAAVVLAHKPKQADLEDLLQEVALTVVQKIDQLEDPGALRPWLRMVAVNTARADGRKQTRRKGLLRLIRPEARADENKIRPETQARQERARELAALIDHLPENYRECVLLRCVRGMSHRQIGDITGLPETTVETRIARGRRMLRELATTGASAPRRMAVDS